MPHPDVDTRDLSQQAILLFLKKLAREELELPPETVAKIELKTPLVGGLNLDSLAQAVLIAQVEECYGFIFELDDRERLQNAETIGDFTQLILQRAQAKQS